MEIERLRIPDVLLLSPRKHEDARGFFVETFRLDLMREFGVTETFVQDNHVSSFKRGTLRGLHFQVAPRAQGKLVRCVRGRILDVAVDMRRTSPTFAQHLSVELSANNGHQLWVPAGFAHGYITLEDDCEVLYKTTQYYSPEHDSGIAWNDPNLEIDWVIPVDDIILSEKDRNLGLL